MHKTMMSLTLMETHEDQYNLYYNIRQTYGINKTDIEAGFNLHKETYQFTFCIIDYMDALYVDSNKPFVKIMEVIYNNNTQWTSCFNLGHGTSYAKALPNAVYWGPVFPDEDDSSHEVDERVKYSNMILTTKLFSFWPTAVATECGLMGITIEKWYKFMTPLFGIFIILQVVFMVGAVMINYGPF